MVIGDRCPWKNDYITDNGKVEKIGNMALLELGFWKKNKIKTALSTKNKFDYIYRENYQVKVW